MTSRLMRCRLMDYAQELRAAQLAYAAGEAAAAAGAAALAAAVVSASAAGVVDVAGG